jgi:hypothetical protein
VSIASAKGTLYEAAKLLRERMHAVRVEWDDDVRRQFEEDAIEPLEARVAAAMKALEMLASLVQQVRRDCGDEEPEIL